MNCHCSSKMTETHQECEENKQGSSGAVFHTKVSENDTNKTSDSNEISTLNWGNGSIRLILNNLFEHLECINVNDIDPCSSISNCGK